MGLVKLLSVLYFLFTIGLLASRKKFKNSYIIFGLLTYLFIIGYAVIPSTPAMYQSILIFVIFSVMIINFGLMNGYIVLMFGKSKKASIIASIVTSSIFMILLFNLKGIMTYIYIPIALYGIQKTMIERIVKIN